jgi:ABC-type nitrate/sulfonate/bicarbonate transport system substrate-binding protein
MNDPTARPSVVTRHRITRTQACTMLAGAAVLGRMLEPTAAAASAQDLPTLACGLIGKTASQWPWYVGDQLGFFKKHGVGVQLIVVGSVASCAQQLTAGALNVGEVSSTQVVEAVKGGAQLKYVVNGIENPPYWLVAKREIRSIGQLKGKTIIIGGVNDITHLFLDAMMTPSGLRPDDYTLTYAGATNVRYAALLSGSVDAALLFPPYSFIAEGQGYANLGNSLTYFGSFPFIGATAGMPWAETHPAAMLAFVKGYLESVRWLNDQRNKAEAVKILASQTNIDAAIAAKSYDALFTQLHAFSLTGVTRAQEMAKVVSSLIKLKQIDPPAPPPEQFFDNRFVERAIADLKRER